MPNIGHQVSPHYHYRLCGHDLRPGSDLIPGQMMKSLLNWSCVGCLQNLVANTGPSLFLSAFVTNCGAWFRQLDVIVQQVLVSTALLYHGQNLCMSLRSKMVPDRGSRDLGAVAPLVRSYQVLKLCFFN